MNHRENLSPSPISLITDSAGVSALSGTQILLSYEKSEVFSWIASGAFQAGAAISPSSALPNGRTDDACHMRSCAQIT
jgi:hypothetical protein